MRLSPSVYLHHHRANAFIHVLLVYCEVVSLFTYHPLQQLFRDYVMALFVLCLVVIDVVILGVYTLTEGLRGNLGVRLTTNRELPEEILGVSI